MHNRKMELGAMKIENHSLEPLSEMLSLTYSVPGDGLLRSPWGFPSPFLTTMWSPYHLSLYNLHSLLSLLVDYSSFVEAAFTIASSATFLWFRILFDSDLDFVFFLQSLLVSPFGICYSCLATVIAVVFPIEHDILQI